MRSLVLLTALLAAWPAAAKNASSSAGGAQKEFSHSKDCMAYSLPAEVRPYVVEATEAEAAASGMRKHIKPTGEGGICTGKIYKVTGALHVYRVTSESSFPKAFGGWWSGRKSDEAYASKKAWRFRNEVCTPWNPSADHHFSCKVKRGAFIAIGSGQSVDCAKLNSGSEKFPATGIVQIAVDSRKDIAAADCTPPAKGSKW